MSFFSDKYVSTHFYAILKLVQRKFTELSVRKKANIKEKQLNVL